MTTNSVVDIRTYSFQKQDRLFLDACVWLSVYGPFARRRVRAAHYSNALIDIRGAGCSIYLDVLILSEFINAFARWEYNSLRSKPPNSKPLPPKGGRIVCD